MGGGDSKGGDGQVFGEKTDMEPLHLKTEWQILEIIAKVALYRPLLFKKETENKKKYVKDTSASSVLPFPDNGREKNEGYRALSAGLLPDAASRKENRRTRGTRVNNGITRWSF